MCYMNSSMIPFCASSRKLRDGVSVHFIVFMFHTLTYKSAGASPGTPLVMDLVT